MIFLVKQLMLPHVTKVLHQLLFIYIGERPTENDNFGKLIERKYDIIIQFFTKLPKIFGSHLD